MNKEYDIPSIIIRSLSGAAGPEEEHALQEWLARSENHRLEYEQVRHLWAESAMVDYAVDARTESEWETLAGRLHTGKTRARRLPLWRYAAAAVAVLGLVGFAALYFGGGLNSGPAIAQQYEALPGQTRQVSLADGTAVNLNAGSTLSVVKGFGKGERRLLLEGEAYFKVSHNPQQPFYVTANGATVRVTGTAFNLKAYPKSEAVNLAVSEGSVAFSSQRTGDSQAVQAGQAAVVALASGQLSAVPYDSLALGWQNGLLVFDNTPFPEVLRALERQFAIEIQDNTRLQSERYSSIFDNRPLDDILGVMGATLGFVPEKRDGKVVLQ
ncbi:MAG: FecR domain-containing protein [Phaeodactylibacter sp.]|nr:FecR domain-containing protein [Phaeodactylibacter sp.]MCB9273339.1 FecR domain-containing protein [Lewinellaceae bacterium]